MLVTGASSGIGREAAVVLSQLGARVMLVARSEQRLEETRKLLEPGDHRIEVVDLSRVEEIPGWMKDATSSFGELDGLVHAAGVQSTRPVRAWTLREYESVFQINVAASLALAKGFRQKRVHQPRASLVFLSSTMGLVGAGGRGVYSASKSAIIGLTKSLALELVREGIRVNCVAPGVVRTEMLEGLRQDITPEQFEAIEKLHPMGIGDPKDVAMAIAFLIADTSRWTTGTTLVVDGGYTAH